MDVLFYIPRKSDDTVKDMKKKIEKYLNIPVSKQTLNFNGQLLQDNVDIWKYGIYLNSRVELLITEDSRVRLNIKNKISSSDLHFPLQMDKNETVLKLKEKTYEIVSDIPMNKLVLHVKGTELQDNQFLRDCDFLNNNEIVISLRQPEPTPTPISTIGVGGSHTVMVFVHSNYGTQTKYVEVNSSDNVGELRKQLQILHRRSEFRLPKSGYIFIHKNSIMHEDRSFDWHLVSHGDNIQVYNGIVLTNI